MSMTPMKAQHVAAYWIVDPKTVSQPYLGGCGRPSPDRGAFSLADDPDAGKTIMAGFFIRGAEAGDLQRGLISIGTNALASSIVLVCSKHPADVSTACSSPGPSCRNSQTSPKTYQPRLGFSLRTP